MTLQGMEGKMFSPLAYTITIALGISLLLSLTLSPALASYVLKGGSEHDTLLVRMLKRPYRAVLARSMANAWKTVAVAILLFAGAALLFPCLGTSFIPEMKEGSISPNMHRVPNISIDESIKMEMAALRVVSGAPGVVKAVSRLGRGSSPADPVGPDEAEVIATLTPRDKRPKGWTQDTIVDEIRRRLGKIPGVNLVMAQPISDRVDEMVTGVRADVAVKLFGDDLDLLIAKANEIAKVASTIRGQRDSRIDKLRRPAVPDHHHRPAGDRAHGPERLRRARRDRNRARRPGGNRNLRGRAAVSTSRAVPGRASGLGERRSGASWSARRTGTE